MRVRWIGLPRVVNGGMRLQGEEFEVDEATIAPHLADQMCQPVTTSTRPILGEEED